MRRSFLSAVVALAMVTASASALNLYTYNTEPGEGGYYVSGGPAGFNVAAITDDGTQIFARVGGQARQIDVATGTILESWGTTYGQARGLANWAGNGDKTVVVAVAGNAGGNTPTGDGLYGVNETTNGVGGLRGSSGPQAMVHAFQNAVSVDYNTGNGWIVGQGKYGTVDAGKGLGYKVTSGDVTDLAGTILNRPVWFQPGAILQGVSNGGLAAGYVNGTGAILADLNSNTAGSITAVPLYPSAQANSGKADGISAGGTYAGGYFGTTDADYKGAFRYLVGSASSERLYGIGGLEAGNPKETRVHDISDNGIAVGYTFSAATGNVATVWLEGETMGTDLLAYLVANGAAVPSDVAKLTVCASITAVPNSQGLYSIAGQYQTMAGGTGAFVATVPEPATLVFLALGGLAMLHRRRF